MDAGVGREWPSISHVGEEEGPLDGVCQVARLRTRDIGLAEVARLRHAGMIASRLSGGWVAVTAPHSRPVRVCFALG